MEAAVVSSRRRNDVEVLIGMLSHKDGSERQRARDSLVKIGSPSVLRLVDLLKNKRKQLRWEAAKALAEIKDQSAAPALAAALTDESEEIRWIAAEGLMALGEGAIVPLLEGIRGGFDSVWYRQGTHHVLHALERKGLLTDDVKQVLDALGNSTPIVTVPWAAQKALDSLEARKYPRRVRKRSASSQRI